MHVYKTAVGYSSAQYSDIDHLPLVLTVGAHGTYLRSVLSRSWTTGNCKIRWGSVLQLNPPPPPLFQGAPHGEWHEAEAPRRRQRRDERQPERHSLRERERETRQRQTETDRDSRETGRGRYYAAVALDSNLKKYRSSTNFDALLQQCMTAIPNGRLCFLPASSSLHPAAPPLYLSPKMPHALKCSSARSSTRTLCVV